MRIAFIGAGKMATALGRGLIQAGVVTADCVTASDIYPPAREAFADATGAGAIADTAAAVAAAEVVVLAVKPQDAAAVLEPLSGQFSGKLFISIAAGLTLERLCVWTGSDCVVRVMPNTPALVARAASVFACAGGVSDADRETTHRILGAVGIVREMTEDKLDAVTALSGSGPAYVFELVQALVEGAVAMGLAEADALDLTVQTVAGAAEMLARKTGTPDALRTAVTSKGGTTAAGLAVLDQAGFREIMARVIRAATERSIELGRG